MRMASLFILAMAMFRGREGAVNTFNEFAPLLKKSSASAAAYTGPPPSRVPTESWLDALKYVKTLLAKTIEYAKLDLYADMSCHTDGYVFCGPIVGPITAEDV
jgi:hypothetical protein